MMSIATATTMRCRFSHPVTASTGTHCPISGQWNPDGDQKNGQVFFEGSLMPPFAGTPVLWVLQAETGRH